MSCSTWNTYFLELLEKYILRLCFWESDPVRIGKIIRFLHHLITYTTILVYIAVHTVVPSYFLLCGLYIWIGLVWVHHVLSGGCIVSKLEQRLIGDTISFVDPILEAFHMPITPETTSGVVIMGSTLVMLMLSFELSVRTIMTLRSYLRF
jgi:hypothetical protein